MVGINLTHFIFTTNIYSHSPRMLIASILFLFVIGANAVGKWYSIWPKDITVSDQNQKITDDLNSRIGGGNIHVSKSGIGNHYWYALLSDDDKQHYDDFDGVGIPRIQ